MRHYALALLLLLPTLASAQNRVEDTEVYLTVEGKLFSVGLADGTAAPINAADCSAETGAATGAVCIDNDGTGIWYCPSPGDCSGVTAWVRKDDTAGSGGTECASAPCDLNASTTIGTAAIQTGTDDDVPESGDFGAATDLEATGAISANAVALTTDTTGNYVATIADSGEGMVTVVNGGGAEAAAVTLALHADITRDSEVGTLTVSATDVTDGSTACTTGDTYMDTDGPAASGTPRFWLCVDGGTSQWAFVDFTN